MKGENNNSKLSATTEAIVKPSICSYIFTTFIPWDHEHVFV